jgi:hypothetical protein
MRCAIRLLQRVAAMMKDVASEPALDTIPIWLPARNVRVFNFTDGCELEGIADDDQMRAR